MITFQAILSVLQLLTNQVLHKKVKKYRIKVEAKCENNDLLRVLFPENRDSLSNASCHLKFIRIYNYTIVLYK